LPFFEDADFGQPHLLWTHLFYSFLSKSFGTDMSTICDSRATALSIVQIFTT